MVEFLNFDKKQNYQYNYNTGKTQDNFDCRFVKNKDKTQFIEMKRTFSGAAAVVIYVSNNGWDYFKKAETTDGRKEKYGTYYDYKSAKEMPSFRKTTPTKHLNVRIAMNGALLLTFDDFDLIHKAISLAKEML